MIFTRFLAGKEILREFLPILYIRQHGEIQREFLPILYIRQEGEVQREFLPVY